MKESVLSVGVASLLWSEGDSRVPTDKAKERRYRNTMRRKARKITPEKG